MASEANQHPVAVIGAGPAGIYAARQLAEAGAQVALLNRDIKIGGLAEYGIYYDKHKMKDGLRRQFRQILELPNINYFGNVTIGQDRGLRLQTLQQLGFQGILVAVGAQGTKWLGLPGEQLQGVYHAKDLVYHYNRLPPYSQRDFNVCCHVALIGAGNVMLDIAHWLVYDIKVNEVIAIVRRGPAEVKFTRKEMEPVARNLDLEALEVEMQRVAPLLQSIGQDVQEAQNFILSALPKAPETKSTTRFRFQFLASPTRILGDKDGHVCGLEVEDMRLERDGEDIRARGLGSRRVIDVDIVIFCIGDRVDATFGLPVLNNEFVKNPVPAYPVDGLSYEAYDPQAQRLVEGIFVAGWSRQASSGLVGLARRDGENGARAVWQYLQQQAPPSSDPAAILLQLKHLLQNMGQIVVTKEEIVRLDAIEKAEARRLGVENFKFKTNEEMLAALGLLPAPDQSA